MIKRGVYCIQTFATSGLSPWTHFHQTPEGWNKLCTTAVNLGNKLVSSEEELENVMVKLQDAVESCCKPDLIDLEGSMKESKEQYDGRRFDSKGYLLASNEEKNKIRALLALDASVELDWISKS